MRCAGVLLLAVLSCCSGAARAATVTRIDDAAGEAQWTATASDGAQVWVALEPSPNGLALRVDYDFGTGSGYVIVRRDVSLTLPDNFAFTFHLLGEGPRNNLEFKLVDPSRRTVWWWRQRDLTWPTTWQLMTVRRSRLEKAWGQPDARLHKVSGIEFAITAAQGGSGSVWIDALSIEERPTPAGNGSPPTVTASSFEPGHEPPRVLDASNDGWRSVPGVEDAWLLFDFGAEREYGGLIVDWDPTDRATAFAVEASIDGSRWVTIHTTENGGGPRDYLYLPESESRFLRLRFTQSSRGQGYAIRHVQLQPITFSASPNQFFDRVAHEEPHGLFPRYLLGQQTYWTVVGVPGDAQKALMNEDGTIEVERGGFSIEPFVSVDNHLVTWADVETTQGLEDDALPIPSVTWKHPAVGLRVTAFASGAPGSSMLYGRYVVSNPTGRRLTGKLHLAIRPFQVLPPWQDLNMVGGVSPIRELRYDSGVVRVNRSKVVVPFPAPASFDAEAFEEGGLARLLDGGTSVPRTGVTDPTGFAVGILTWALDLAPGARTEVDVVVPFHEPYVEILTSLDARDAQKLVAAELQTTRKQWHSLLDRVGIELPTSAARLDQTRKTALGQALINRDGAAIQPGPRTYARAWIRDGADTSLAFLQMGFPGEVAEFIRWYARYQLPDGRVPCCVDRRGADNVPEHDSPGQFIWLVAQYYRFTRDVGLVSELWPNVVRAVEYLERLRAQRTTEAYRVPAMAAFFGLLPESISHEGYSSHPVHSYWDDYWALAGLRAAPGLANAVGDLDRYTAFNQLALEFEEDVVASIPRTMAMHTTPYVPGSVELGDFDPTSTAIAVTIAGLEDRLAGPLNQTFDQYLEEVRNRPGRGGTFESYSPYELRNVEALVRLGRRADAHELLAWIMADQRPPAWHQWAEVSWQAPRAPRFIGDMPHTWIASIFVRVLRTMLVYERAGDRALVIGAGVLPDWITREQGVRVRRMPTYYGALSYDMRAEGQTAVRVRLFGDVIPPPGGIVVTSPLDAPIVSATSNGKPVVPTSPTTVTIGDVPADVLLRFREPAAGG